MYSRVPPFTSTVFNTEMMLELITRELPFKSKEEFLILTGVIQSALKLWLELSSTLLFNFTSAFLICSRPVSVFNEATPVPLTVPSSMLLRSPAASPKTMVPLPVTLFTLKVLSPVTEIEPLLVMVETLTSESLILMVLPALTVTVATFKRELLAMLITLPLLPIVSEPELSPPETFKTE